MPLSRGPNRRPGLRGTGDPTSEFVPEGRGGFELVDFANEDALYVGLAIISSLAIAFLVHRTFQRALRKVNLAAPLHSSPRTFPSRHLSAAQPDEGAIVDDAAVALFSDSCNILSEPRLAVEAKGQAPDGDCSGMGEPSFSLNVNPAVCSSAEVVSSSHEDGDLRDTVVQPHHGAIPSVASSSNSCNILSEPRLADEAKGQAPDGDLQRYGGTRASCPYGSHFSYPAPHQLPASMFRRRSQQSGCQSANEELEEEVAHRGRLLSTRLHFQLSAQQLGFGSGDGLWPVLVGAHFLRRLAV